MKQNAKKWLFAAGSLTLVAYLAVIGTLSTRARAQRLCEGIFIQVIDSARQNFVTVTELRNELGRLPMIARSTPLDCINTDSLAQILRVIDKIESVQIKRLTDGTIHITVEPMRPIARVFEADRSYYINKDGKRISAEARYHVDVPVIAGNFPDSSFTAASLLPLVEFINSNKRWSHLVTMIKADSPHDILIVPAIRGLIFNIGTADNLPDKFSRLERMMQEVLPTKGWEYYDTISVKWRGQAVATRRHKMHRDTTAVAEDVRENDDIETMTVGANVAVGQALPGKKANSEKPIPGADLIDGKKSGNDTKQTEKNNDNNKNKNKTT